MIKSDIKIAWTQINVYGYKPRQSLSGIYNLVNDIRSNEKVFIINSGTQITYQTNFPGLCMQVLKIQ